MKQRKLFCQYHPVCYWISERKERLLRRLRDLLSRERFAACQQQTLLPAVVVSHRSPILRPLAGVDMVLQQNKATNLWLASVHLDQLVIGPGETFSFWRRVGNCTAAKGYLPGLTISSGKISSSVGGGLCQLANLIHWMVLQSPLTVTELHHHTDAIFPDSNRRVPFGTGTSIYYNNVDYRFRNDTDRTFQLHIWLEGGDLCGELLCDRSLPFRWRIEERDHHYHLEEDGWYRNSEIWKRTIRKSTGVSEEEYLIFRNHSKVLFDPSFIPQEEIR
ncbi:VanW family protein [Angelakisella massiliensis]|uniref:VanW family protein n=1 Tax=Angelakisella massiliensis TaxID=1871018 RepID=UPI0023A7F272|nr:VanW family protein [Angelakisella massiliensis]